MKQLKTKSWRYALISAGILVLMLLLYFEGIRGTAALEQSEKQLSLKSSSGGWEAASIRQWQDDAGEEQESFLYTAWSQTSGQTIENKTLNKGTAANVIQICGSSRLLFGNSNVLTAEDSGGCLIDQKSARALFGTANPVGQTVDWQGASYTIRGSITADEKTLVIQAGNKTLLDTITAQIQTGQSRHSLKQELTGKYGLQAEELEWWLLLQILRSGNLLLPFTWGVVILMLLFQLKKRTKTGARWQVWLGLGVFAVVWSLFLIKNISVPSDLLPGEWSDFTFWSKLWEDKKEAMLLLLKSEKRGPELTMSLSFIKCMVTQMITWLLGFLLLYLGNTWIRGSEK